MNLYRSFGCLLESWVAEGYQDEDGLERQLDANGSDSTSTDSVRLSGAPLRSESEDSGVELPTAVSSPTFQYGVPASNGSATFMRSDADVEDVRPSSCSSPPSVCSSSSSCFSLVTGVAQASRDSIPAAEPAVEQLPHWRRVTGIGSSSPTDSVDSCIPRGRSNTVSTPGSLQIPSSNGVCQRGRSGSLGPRRPCVPPADQHTAEARFRHQLIPPKIVLSNGDPTEVWCSKDHDWSEVSPGLLYLEQVCRMLEQIARLQRKNQSLQVEMKNLHPQKAATQQQSAIAQKTNSSTISSPKNSSTAQVQRHDEQPNMPSDSFRGRSMSDTLTLLKHRKKVKFPKGEHFTSTEILLEEPDGVHQPVESEVGKTGNSLKQKFRSLKRNDKLRHSDNNGPQSEKKTLLKNLFRGRRRTTRL